MRHSPFLLPVAGFTIAVGCALTPRPEPPPFYGIDPDTKVCTTGTLEGTCTTGSAIRCTVTIGSNFGIPAFDNKSGTTCTTPLFRPNGEDPDTLFIHQ